MARGYRRSTYGVGRTADIPPPSPALGAAERALCIVLRACGYGQTGGGWWCKDGNPVNPGGTKTEQLRRALVAGLVDAIAGADAARAEAELGDLPFLTGHGLATRRLVSVGREVLRAAALIAADEYERAGRPGFAQSYRALAALAENNAPVAAQGATGR